MIIGQDFIWLHMPKTAGSTTRLFLKRSLHSVDGIQFDHAWLRGRTRISPAHQSLALRASIDPEFDAEGKRILCGFRRLPAWLLSNVHFHESLGRDFGVTRDNLVRGEFRRAPDGRWMTADDRLRLMGPETVDAWVRQEHLEEDLAEALRGLSIAPYVTDIPSLPIRKETTLDYVKRFDFWFTEDELQALYAANPLWAELETRLYGHLIGQA